VDSARRENNRHANKQVAGMKLAQQNRRRAKAHHTPQADMASALLNAASDHALLMCADGTVLTTNNSMARIFRLRPEQLAGESIYDFLPCHEAQKLAKAVRNCLAANLPLHFEDALSTGQELEIRMHPVPGDGGAADRVAVFCRDISEQKAAERDRTRLASALEQAADAVILFDEQMCIEYLNQSFEAMTGYTLRELRGRSVTFLYDGLEQMARLNEVSEALARGDVWSGKACNICKDGQVICCHKTVAPIRGKGGCILGYVSVWRDVTAVETLERQLRQAQKMEAIGTLASGIAHDFNNILSPIVLLADIGLRQLAQGDPLRASLESILKAGLRAGDLVRQILGLGRRLECDQPKPLRLAAILQECLALVRPGLPSSIGISLKAHTERDVIMADPAQLHQLVMNLCTNAAWAMRGTGGTLEFGITEQVLGPRGDPEFPAAEPGSYVLLRVRDSGHGDGQQERKYERPANDRHRSTSRVGSSGYCSAAQRGRTPCLRRTGLATCCGARSYHGVAHEHRTRHRAHATRHRRDRRRERFHGGEINVAHHALVRAVDADIDHDGPRLHIRGIDHLRPADRSHEQVCSAAHRGKVTRARVTYGDRGVGLQQQECHGLADDRRAADHHRIHP